MIYIVAPLPTGRDSLNPDGTRSITRKHRPTVVFHSLEQAEEAARTVAEDAPNVHVAVFAVDHVVEAIQAEPTFVRKKFNQNGEIVPEEA